MEASAHISRTNLSRSALRRPRRTRRTIPSASHCARTDTILNRAKQTTLRRTRAARRSIDDKLQAALHTTGQSRIAARAPFDDEADGALECSSMPEDHCHRGSEMSKVLLAEQLIHHSSAPHGCRTQAQQRSARDHGQQARRGDFGVGGVMLVHLPAVSTGSMT